MVIKLTISIFLGFTLGVLRELLVVGYQGAVIDLNPRKGASTTWGIGHLDFIVMYALARLDNPFMFYSYIYGETAASYFGIARRKAIRSKIKIARKKKKPYRKKS